MTISEKRATGGGKKKGAKAKWLQKENLETLKLMKQAGATDLDIIAHCQISYSTYYRWIRDYPEFADAMIYSKQETIARVKDALIKLALGYEVTETKHIIEDPGMAITSTGRGRSNNQARMRQRTEVTKRHIPPKFEAIQFYLCNEDHENFKKNRDVVSLNTDGEEHEGLQINIVTVKGKQRDSKVENQVAEGQRSKKHNKKRTEEDGIEGDA